MGENVSETKAVATRQVTAADWQVIQTISPTIHLSRLFGVGSAEQAAVIALTGHELGLGLAASFSFIQVVQGKPTLSPRGALALVMNSGLLAGLKTTETEDACTVWMKRRGDPELEYEFTWTQADSERAGLVKVGDKGPGAHITYPKLMRKWRAIGFCIDYLFSDVCAGMKRADEFGATVNDKGDVIEGEWAPMPTVEVQPVPTAPKPTVTLNELVDRYGAEVVMQAANGIPSTDEEVQEVARKLEAEHGR
jgi:hypothetical protein